MLQFHAPVEILAAEGDTQQPARISGVAVPWDVTATVSGGQRVKFLRGAFNVNQKPAKLVENHDLTQLRGVVTSLTDTDTGLRFEATLANTRASQDAVELLKAGAYDSVSVGANPTKFKFDKTGTMIVSAADLIELSLVAVPAFSDAVITEIAASADPEDDEENPPQDTPEEDTVSEPIQAEAPEAPATHPVSPIVYAAARKEVPLPTAAEYLAAAIAGGSAWHDMSAALRAAAPDVITTDTPGILPQPIVGPVYNNFIGRRPVVDAVGVKAMPGGGKVFIRPEVTTHTSMAVQSAENAALQSGTYVVYNNQVTKAAYGGYVTISEQDLDWTDPNVLSLVLDDMARIYANTTDNVAADNLLAGCTQSSTLTDPTSASEWVSDVYDCASTILSASNGNLPTHLFLSPNMWQYLGALSDDSKRPLFPQVGPMNAFGTLSPGATDAVAFGLRVVVDRNFASDTVIVGDASGFEIFEQQKGAISIDNPSTISRTIAWRGYFATLMIDATKFVKLT